MTAGVVQEQNLRKHMGCIAGFFHIFDRHHHLTGKRLCSAKTVPSYPVTKSPSPPEKNAVPTEVLTPSPDRSMPSEPLSPAPQSSTPFESAPKSPLPLPVFDFKEGTMSPWKLSKEAPRFSLDSKAIFDAKGNLKPREIRTSSGYLAANSGIDDVEKQRSSPSVIARLMGLEPLPDSGPKAGPVKKAELRRSASESRVSKDLFQYRFIDEVNFQVEQNPETNSQSNISRNFIIGKGKRQDKNANSRASNSRELTARTAKSEQWRATQKVKGSRKCFYDSADVFPELKQTVSLHGEIEKRLKMRRIDDPSKDLETLKQILDTMQLKGLLHSEKSSNQTNNRTFFYEESPIVVMKPAKSPGPARRLGIDSPPLTYKMRYGSRLNLNPAGETLPAVSPRSDPPSRTRRSISPATSEVSAKSPTRRKPLKVESPRRGRVSAVQSPKVPSRGIGLDQTANRWPRIKKATAGINQKVEKPFDEAEDELSSASWSSVSKNSQTGTEIKRSCEGRNLLERCDKLLQSIAELQPSPVSVLDESFYKEDESPSAIMKRRIDFQEQPVESEDDESSLATMASEDKLESDFLYVSDVLRASSSSCEDSDVFLLLEKQQYFKGKNTSEASTLGRRLIFDTVNEILYQKRQLPPWKTSSCMEHTSLVQVWSEIKKIRERDSSGDLFQVICSVLRKDLGGDAISGWEDFPVEMSEAVLCIERLIFKDLIGETIQHLAALSERRCGGKVAMPWRRMVF